jgi:type I restriction enzyme, S subunit
MEFMKYKISDIGQVIAGGTPSTNKKEYWNGSVPWITPKDLSNYNTRFITSGERNITELRFKIFKC